MNAPISLRSAGAPISFDTAGIEPRFRFWRGRSGRRYLFTEVEFRELPNFRDVVLLTASETFSGDFVARSVGLWPLHPDQGRLVSWNSGNRYFVHFLATSIHSRRIVVADLLTSAAAGADG
jgi:hypothetical protein